MIHLISKQVKVHIEMLGMRTKVFWSCLEAKKLFVSKALVGQLMFLSL